LELSGGAEGTVILLRLCFEASGLRALDVIRESWHEIATIETPLSDTLRPFHGRIGSSGAYPWIANEIF
jgi:hypothetical protein